MGIPFCLYILIASLQQIFHYPAVHLIWWSTSWQFQPHWQKRPLGKGPIGLKVLTLKKTKKKSSHHKRAWDLLQTPSPQKNSFCKNSFSFIFILKKILNLKLPVRPPTSVDFMEREVHCHLTIWMVFLVVATRLFYLLLFINVVVCMMTRLTIFFPSVEGISCLLVFCPFFGGFFFVCLPLFSPCSAFRLILNSSCCELCFSQIQFVLFYFTLIYLVFELLFLICLEVSRWGRKER